MGAGTCVCALLFIINLSKQSQHNPGIYQHNLIDLYQNVSLQKCLTFQFGQA